MSTKAFRVLVGAAKDTDRGLLAQTITQAGFCEEVVSVPPENLAQQLSQRRCDAVVLDCTGVGNILENTLQSISPARVICIVEEVQEELITAILQQGADVLVKDSDGIYVKMLPRRMKVRLNTLGQAAANARSEMDPLPSEYELLAQSLFEHSPNMIFINVAGRVVYVNEKCVEIMGYERDEFYSPDFNFLSLATPESLDVIKNNYARHLRGEEVEPYNYTLVTRAGRRLEAVMSTKLIQYRGRQAILGIVTDISRRKQIEEELTRARNELERRIEERTIELVKTNESLLTEIKDRQRAEQALRESEERYRTLSSLISDYAYAMCCENSCALEWISGAFEKITGYRTHEIASMDDWLRVIHPDDVPAIRAATERIAAGDTFEWEYRIRTKDGRIRWLHDHAHPVRDEQTGRIVAAVGAVRDITERKQAIEALKESELKFKTLFENAGGAIFVADADTGRIIECNHEAEKLTGLPRHKLIGMHQTELHAPHQAELYRRKFEANVARGGLFNFECEVQHADGHTIPVWISTQIMLLTERKVIMGLFLDMSAKKRADQQRMRLTEILEEKNRELESIIHVASHDFRTPLITISGFAGELQRSCRQLNDLLASGRRDKSVEQQTQAIVSQDIPEAVNLISASAAKLHALLDGLTRLARFEPPGDEMAPVDMNAMLAEIIKMLTYQARHRAVEFRLEPLPEAWGDEQQLSQVFSNLLDNAIKYLHPDRPGLITITGQRADDHTLYCIQDNGIGIDTNNLPHIFKMYYRIDPKQAEGQGLGLAIVRRIVSRHNGKVWAESEEGQGSRFYVALPNSPT